MERLTQKRLKYIGDIYMNKLQWLEDCLENGKMIKLPCNIGDTVYVVYKDKWEYSIYAASAVGFHIDESGVEIITDFVCYPCDRIGNFIDKNEAEAKLKELQGE